MWKKPDPTGFRCFSAKWLEIRKKARSLIDLSEITKMVHRPLRPISIRFRGKLEEHETWTCENTRSDPFPMFFGEMVGYTEKSSTTFLLNPSEMNEMVLGPHSVSEENQKNMRLEHVKKPDPTGFRCFSSLWLEIRKKANRLLRRSLRGE